MELTDAYVAGFVDGEGYVGMVGRGTRLTIGQKYREVLDAINVWLSDLGIKGIIYFRPPKPESGRPNGIYTLNVSARDDVQAICERLLPYLIVKQKDASRVLRWLKEHPRKSHVGPLDVDKLRRLANEGFTCGMIGERMGCKSGKVSKVAKANGIPIQVYVWRKVNGVPVKTLTPEEAAARRIRKNRVGVCPDCDGPMNFDSARCRPCADKRRIGTSADKLKGKWSLNHDGCVVCGTTERKHICKGMCCKCREDVRRKEERNVRAKREKD